MQGSCFGHSLEELGLAPLPSLVFHPACAVARAGDFWRHDSAARRVGAELPSPLLGTGSAQRTSFCTDKASAPCPRLIWLPATSALPSCSTPRSPLA